VQDQLGLKETALAKLLGGQVISDVALIGRDTYLREGAALGILFEARDNEARGNVLKSDLMGQRREAAARLKSSGAEVTSIDIDGQEVSVAATNDNRLRSFYVVDGRYHLVTTSVAIVRQFLATGRGEGRLADSNEFRLARQALPLDRDDTVLAYLSPQFFQGLMSPQYQIELRRRLRRSGNGADGPVGRAAGRTR
jgi:hypothetical protein